MFVKYIGHDPLLLTEFNGKRFAFHRNKPVEITPQVYNEIILSKHISASEVVPCEPPVSVKSPAQEETINPVSVKTLCPHCKKETLTVNGKCKKCKKAK